MKVLRQGDVLLIQVAALPKAANEVARNGDVILAYGEVTGHAHRIAAEPTSLRVFDYGAERYIQALDVVALTHEEHSTITIDPGIYRQGHQVEDFGEAVRPVAD